MISKLHKFYKALFFKFQRFVSSRLGFHKHFDFVESQKLAQFEITSYLGSPATSSLTTISFSRTLWGLAGL